MSAYLYRSKRQISLALPSWLFHAERTPFSATWRHPRCGARVQCGAKRMGEKKQAEIEWSLFFCGVMYPNLGGIPFRSRHDSRAPRRLSVDVYTASACPAAVSDDCLRSSERKYWRQMGDKKPNLSQNGATESCNVPRAPKSIAPERKSTHSTFSTLAMFPKPQPTQADTSMPTNLDTLEAEPEG